MKNNKTDPRARYTQSVIRKSLLKLLAQKPLKNVTVAEVCREAQVTRGTFYNHYYDVFDVYASIENDFFEEIKTRISGRKTYELDDSFFREIMSFLSENSDVMNAPRGRRGERDLKKNYSIHAGQVRRGIFGPFPRARPLPP